MNDPRSGLRHFFAELRRRRVYRVAVVYAAVAFVIWQAADFALPALRLPDWVPTLVVVLTLVGLPIALVLAWAFDLTPEGIRRTESTAVEPAPGDVGGRGEKSRTGRRLLLSSAIALVVILVGSGVFYYLVDGRPEILSIAVLPLDNLSGDPEEEYFADGMTDALTTQLSQISALRVISRVSAMQYKGAQRPLPDIARELNVDAVVGGSVVRSEDRVRISAQLIHGPTDRNLWAQSYERDLRDVLALQADVARAIAAEVEAKLEPTEETRLASVGRVNSEAYQLYLKGRYLLWQSWTTGVDEEGLRRSIAYYEEALRLDPRFALAYSGMADSYFTLTDRSFIVPVREGYESAKEAALKALELDSSLADAWASLCTLRLWYDWDWSGAEEACLKAIDLDPNSANARNRYAYYLMTMGRFDEAIEEIDRARDLDPLNLGHMRSLGMMYHYARRYDEAVNTFNSLLEIDPDSRAARDALADARLRLGMFEQAVRHYEARIGPDSSTTDLANLAEAYAVAGNRARALDLLNLAEERSRTEYHSPYHLARLYATLGDNDRAMEWLEVAYDERSGWLPLIMTNASWDGLRSDPRFEALLERMGFEHRR